jgi:hypothetical protein
MEKFGIFYGHLVFLKLFVELHILPFGIFCVHSLHFFTILVCCAKKNLATLVLCYFDRPSS